MLNTRPAADEYAAYYGKYVDLVLGDDIVLALRQQLDGTLALLRGVAESQGNCRYQPGKWSIKEVLGHLIDTERIFGYRALRIARNDPTPLAGFEQDDYVLSGNFDHCALADLTAEFELVRRSNVAMFQHFGDDAWRRRGVASAHPVSVRALAYMIAGHELHHRNLLQLRYL
ncbi:MAG: DinB family protein [Gemmatimonadales bacterium]